ncbi:hypothetical protein GTO27_04245, partial [Candidatus Bathyarchaeota archaeon]|nr:hypothetical protein [Candidatus Bathyarchaeota archaeon]
MRQDGFTKEATMMENQVMQIEALKRWDKARREKRATKEMERLMKENDPAKEASEKVEDELFEIIEAGKLGFDPKQLEAAEPEVLSRIVEDRITPEQTEIVNGKLTIKEGEVRRVVTETATPAAADFIKANKLN